MFNKMNAGSMQRETFEENMQKLGDLGHEVALTGIGLVTLGLQDAYRLWQERDAVLEKAQRLGVEIEDDAIGFARDAGALLTQRTRSFGAAGICGADPRRTTHTLATKLRNLVDAELAGMDATPCEPPVSQEIEITLMAPPPPVDAAAKQPFANYDNMTAKDIVAKLATLSSATLTAIQQYEEQNRQRVTILRAVERRLA